MLSSREAADFLDLLSRCKIYNDVENVRAAFQHSPSFLRLSRQAQEEFKASNPLIFS
jgi:hypothetical protein